MKFYAIFMTCSLLLVLQQVKSSELDELPRRTHMLENQVQRDARDQQFLAQKLIRNGVFEVEKSARQLQFAQMSQNIAANMLSAKGLVDLNNIELFGLSGLSADAVQCYLSNKFTFGDAMNTARNTSLQCISDKMNQGKTILDNAINNIRTAAQNISNGAELISVCSQFTLTYPSMAGLIARATCLSQGLLTMKSSAILLPINLGQRVVEANAAISTIQSDIMMCNLNILSEIITQSMKSGQAITDCISQSTNSTTASPTTATA